MFLTKNNSFLWKRFVVVSAIVAGFVILGFSGVDEFLQPYFRMFDWSVWTLFDAFGEWKILAACALVVFTISRVLRTMGHKLSIEKLSANVFCSIVLAEFIVGILKICVGRARPPVDGFNPLSMSDSWHSFPSGHAAAAFALLVSVGLMYPRARPFTWMLAIAAAASRVCVGSHWPSDVLFAALIGMVSSDMIVWFRQSLFTKRQFGNNAFL